MDRLLEWLTQVDGMGLVLPLDRTVCLLCLDML